MNLLKLNVALVLAIALSACASLPDTPAFDLPAKSKVGYEINLAEEVGHTHYGTTVFNNFEKVKEGASWQLNAFAKSEARRLLADYGFEPVEVNLIEEAPVADDKPKRLSDAELQELRNKRLKRLTDEFGVNAMIVLRSHRNLVASECGAYGCSEFYATYPGLYSRGLVFLPPFLNAVLPSSSSAYVVEPYAPIQNFDGPYSTFNSQVALIKGFKPTKFKAMNDEEWLVVKAKVEELITTIIAKNVKALRAGSDGNGGFIREVE